MSLHKILEQNATNSKAFKFINVYYQFSSLSSNSNHFSSSYNMSTYIQDEIPTIMANFTCITGNCSHLESTSVTTSSEAPFEDEPEAVPYTTIQAILIGMASGLLSLVTIVGKLQKIIRELILLLKKPYSQFCCICAKFCSFSTTYYLQRNLCFNKVCKILPSSLLHSNSINGSLHLQASVINKAELLRSKFIHSLH